MGLMGIDKYVGVDALLKINRALFTAISIIGILLHWYLIFRSFKRKTAILILVFCITYMELLLVKVISVGIETGSISMLFFGVSPLLVASIAYVGSKYIGKRFDKMLFVVLILLVTIIAYYIIKYTLHPLSYLPVLPQ